jgi:hypothetical protein
MFFVGKSEISLPSDVILTTAAPWLRLPFFLIGLLKL